MSVNETHSIQPARLMPGVTQDQLESPEAIPGTVESSSLIRGKALIIWDPDKKGKKLDAIDTDQITPAQDCVSESLDELDKNWKEGGVSTSVARVSPACAFRRDLCRGGATGSPSVHPAR